MKSRLVSFGACLVLLAGVGSASATVISEDFEGQTVGLFPVGWLDVGDVNPGSLAPNPSAFVVDTTDAFGNPTRALSIPGAFAASQGIYQTLPVSSLVTITVDVRIDQFSAPSTVNVQDWPINITLSLLDGTTDLALVNSMGVYAASASQTWNTFVITPNVSFAPDFGVTVLPNTWYRVALELDTANGIIATSIMDIALGTTVLDNVSFIPGWTPADGIFDAVSFFDGEISSSSLPNLTVIDNIRVTATVPEPSVLWLLGVGLAMLAQRGRGVSAR